MTTYTGSQDLTFSGASASPGGTAPTVANSLRHGGRLRHRDRDHLHQPASPTSRATKNGVMKIYRAGAASISVTDGTLAATLAAGGDGLAPRRSRNSSSPPKRRPRRSGAADDLTITAQDTYGNAVPTYTGSRA